MQERHKYAHDIDKSRRRAKVVLDRLGFEWNDLSGNAVLDVGAGKADITRVAKTKGINVTSIDLYPFLWESLFLANKDNITANTLRWREVADEYALLASRKISKPKNFLQANAAVLPFADESFDIVFTHAGPPTCWTREVKEAERIVSEMMRVLKPTGECRISPTYAFDIYTQSSRGRRATFSLLKRCAESVQQVSLENKGDTQYFRLTKK